MEIRRLLLFFAIAATIFVSWDFLVLRPMRQEALRQAQQRPQVKEQQPDGEVDRQAADADAPAEIAGDEPPVEAPQPTAVEAARPAHPYRAVTLGSLNPDSRYFLAAELTSVGGAVKAIHLNDPRYRDLTDRDRALTLVNSMDGPTLTFATRIPEIDRQLAELSGGESLALINWELLETTVDKEAPGLEGEPVYSAATFRFVTADGALEIRKRYWLEKSAADPVTLDVRDTDADPYRLRMALSIRNHAEQPKSLQYVLQGPLGLPLENIEHTRKLRDIKFAFLKPNGGVDPESMAVSEVVDAYDEAADKLAAQRGPGDPKPTPDEINNELEIWKRPTAYIGVDVQYFAALVVPVDERDPAEQISNPWIERAQPQLVRREGKKGVHSDISVRLTSQPVTIPAGQELVHTYELFAGPKREALLSPMQATDILDYGMFGAVARFMLWLLNLLHSVGLPYGVAIICLTIVVRACMFPISRKQAVSAKKMKELQPKIAELKKKYGDDKEKLARAQMQLFSEHNYNPFAGCLPILLQFPIFIGLYTALNSAVDLRMAPFLWIDNLAAPDQLFRMPFALPFLGRDFNLLPLITVALFVVQQKMFMPPPADEQQAQQYKMMNVMMIVMGFLFYHVPAGLCVYFIASSLWGMGERKLLDYGTLGATATPEETPAAAQQAGRDKHRPEAVADKEPRKGLFGRLLEAAEASAAATQTHTRENGKSGNKPGGSKKSRRK